VRGKNQLREEEIREDKEASFQNRGTTGLGRPERRISKRASGKECCSGGRRENNH